MVLYSTSYQLQVSFGPDLLQVLLCWFEGNFYGGSNFSFFKLLGIGYWFHAYLIGEYRGGRKYYHSHLVNY